MVSSHEQLRVWNTAMDLAVEVYRLSSHFPKSELYRMTSQLTRAASSVPANIAEGNGRGSARDYARFLSIAKGSLNETETFIRLAIRLGYLTEEQAKAALGLSNQVGRMLTSLRARLV